MASIRNMYLLQHAQSVITQFLYYQIQFEIYFCVYLVCQLSNNNLFCRKKN